MARPGSRGAGLGQGRPVRRRAALPAVLVGVVVAVLVGGHLLGFRLNLTDQHVRPPTAADSPERVVTTYVEAWNHRDFATLAAIYPSQSLPRHRAIGTMSDLVIVSSQSLDGPEDGNPPRPGRAYHRVRITVDLEGFDDSELADRPGRNGWAYLLERDRPDQPWTIADHGNP